jgi:DNA-binding winged helix-turn-helix (wHTH) protein
MNKGVLMINDRFRIYPALNQVEDRQTGRTIRLEPRVMAVLEMLTNRAGQLVSREEMIRDIWHNYGGGDEALSQAVSFLRKILADRDKKIIQTIPKKGYCLTGLLEAAEIRRVKSAFRLPDLRQLARFAVLLYVIGTAVYFLHSGLYLQPQVSPQQAALVTPNNNPQSPIVSVHPMVEKIAQSAQYRRSAAIAVQLKNSNTVSARILPEPAANIPAVLPARTITKYYHSADTTAQMITALDYQVSTQLRVSTTIN